MGFKDFFKRAPEHNLEVGDIVTSASHGGLAIVLELYDTDTVVDWKDAPSMNMAKIWWLRYPHDGIKERIWMHTIDKLKKHPENSGLTKMPVKNFQR